MKKIQPPSRVDTRKYRELFHTIENGIEMYKEYDRKGKEIVTISNPNTTGLDSLSEILYLNKETGLLIKKKCKTTVTYYKYDANQKLVGYYTKEEE